jgi:uncharacterized protein YcbX
MRVVGLARHPVKSVLGESVDVVRLVPGGVDGDRALALLDVATGRLASAKQPRLWRALLRCSAATSGSGDGVLITLPDGRTVPAAAADAPLGALLGREVRLVAQRPAGAVVERPDPVDVLEHGVEAPVPAPELEIAQGTPGGSFVDHSPVHLVTTATLDHLGVEALRYRPNLVLAVDGPPFTENSWLGRELVLGGVRLRVTLPTPRCAVPTLEHGTLPRAPHAVRGPQEHNRVDVPGFGTLPCAGAYAEVVAGGELRRGERRRLA